jgi:selenide,water dikinase
MSGGLPAQSGSGDIIVGNDFADDAAVVRLHEGDERYLVLTTDTIAPLVDEPEDFGAIAAANALSDVYAMGGTPLYALNLVFFPSDDLPLEVLGRIMQGARSLCETAGVSIVGGHSVKNGDLKFGLAVTGEVPRERVLSNRGARAGDALLLSKALGTGIVGTAIKKGVASAVQRDAAIESMKRLNREALEVGLRHDVSACTDVTGFGLLGHLLNILKGSGLDARIDLSALPLLPGALELARQGHVPAGSCSTLNTLRPHLRFASEPTESSELLTTLAADAQTSGGLLLCLPRLAAEQAVVELRQTGHSAALVGELVAPAAPGQRQIELSNG